MLAIPGCLSQSYRNPCVVRGDRGSGLNRLNREDGNLYKKYPLTQAVVRGDGCVAGGRTGRERPPQDTW